MYKAQVHERSWWRRQWNRLTPLPRLSFLEMTEEAMESIRKSAEEILQGCLDNRSNPEPLERPTLTDAELLLREIQNLPKAFVCQCGHPIAMHLRDLRRRQVACCINGCDCTVTEAEVMSSRDPFNPFRAPKAGLMAAAFKKEMRALERQHFSLRYHNLRVVYPSIVDVEIYQDDEDDHSSVSVEEDVDQGEEPEAAADREEAESSS